MRSWGPGPIPVPGVLREELRTQTLVKGGLCGDAHRKAERRSQPPTPVRDVRPRTVSGTQRVKHQPVALSVAARALAAGAERGLWKLPLGRPRVPARLRPRLCVFQPVSR